VNVNVNVVVSSVRKNSKEKTIGWLDGVPVMFVFAAGLVNIRRT
jgi:hypothetical protein